MDTISPSQMRAMACRQKWQWQYPDGYTPILSNKNLEFGKGIHAALDHYYVPDPDLEKDMIEYFSKWMDMRIKAIPGKFDDNIEQFYGMKDLGIVMLEGYLEKWGGKEEFDVLATEKTLRRRLPVPDSDKTVRCDVVSRLDGIVRCHITEKLFSLEHKTYQRYDPKGNDMDIQFTSQVWVGEKYAESLGLDEPIVGVIYNGLRKQAPGPKVKAPLFVRQKIFRNQSEIQSFLHSAYWMYKESRKWKIYPQPNAIECSYCDYREPCTEKMRGGDYQFLLDHNYKKRRPYHGKAKTTRGSRGEGKGKGSKKKSN